jgi:hypothetical protein
MKFSAFAPLAVASVLVSPLASHGALSVYSQNFDSLAPAETNSNNALGDDGWLVFANVFNTDGSYAGGYGAAAPNWFRSFSAVGTGGSVPGNQNMGVYNDYDNRAAQNSGQLVEANVYQFRFLDAADTGTTWVFKFDARRLNLVAPSTARAFIGNRPAKSS